MPKTGTRLAALALVIALIGASAGGFLLIKEYTSAPPEQEPYVRPMARVFREGSYSLLSGVQTTFNFTHKSYDTHDAFNLTSDTYRIPEAGFYQITAQYCIDAKPADFFKIEITLNAVIVTSRSFTAATSTNTFTVSITDIINATVADLVSIKAYSYNLPDNPRLVFEGAPYTFLAIMRIA